MHENLLSNNSNLINKVEEKDTNYNNLNNFEELIKNELGDNYNELKVNDKGNNSMKKMNYKSFVDNKNENSELNNFNINHESTKENPELLSNKVNSNSISSTNTSNLNSMKLELLNKFSEINKAKKST